MVVATTITAAVMAPSFTVITGEASSREPNLMPDGFAEPVTVRSDSE